MRLRARCGRQGILLSILLVLAGSMSLFSADFLTVDNLLGMTRHLAEVGIIACGMTLVIMTGGIDLSVGSLVGLCGIVLGYSWVVWEWGALPALVATLCVGFAGGALNGALVSVLRFPPLVVTLATMALFRGLAMVISKANPVSEFPETFRRVAAGEIGPVPVQLVVWLLVAAVIAFVSGRTRVGRHVMAIGDNERAALFARLPVRAVKFWVYAVTGCLCALAATILTARFSTAKADAGEGFELQAITAVVLGGTSITGGRGTVLGTLLGVLILGVVRNGLSLAGVSTVWQAIVAGAILIVTAVVNQRVVERSAYRVARTAGGSARAAE